MLLTYSETFKRQLKRLSRKYRRIRSDIEPILKRLDAGQVMGDQIPGARHPLYKVRAPNRDAQRGTRGGYRIIYFLVTDAEILLLTVYSKTEQSDIGPEELQRILTDEGFAS